MVGEAVKSPINSQMPILAKSFISFFHPVLMSGTLIGTFYALYLGIQTRRTRNAPSETRKQLIKGKYGLKHFYSGSGLLTFWVIGSLIGMAATYVLYEQLFFSPHLVGGLSIVGLASIAATLVPLMQQGKQWARTAHIVVVMLIVIISSAQMVTGVTIIQDILQEKFWDR